MNPHSPTHLPLESCYIPGVEAPVLCGHLEVPENPQNPLARTIPLNTLVVPALDPQLHLEPLVHLDGGPGLPATGSVLFYARDFLDYRINRDVLLVDQRGTGDSNPLHFAPIPLFREMYPADVVTAERAKLEKSADLTQYTTSRSVEDLEQVRQWLGYERMDLLGFSYGTRLAQAYLRAHPDHVRSAVLVGAVPLDMNLPASLAVDAQHVLNLQFQDCAATAPHFRSELIGFLGRLDRQPVEAPERVGGGLLTREIFMEALRTRLYSPLEASNLPHVVHAAHQGDFSEIFQWGERALNGPQLAEGLYLSVTCSEDVPFIQLDTAVKDSDATLFGSYRIQQQTRACSLWAAQPVHPDFRQPVESDAPVLIISGGRDPITPPRWGQQVARTLPNSSHVVIESMGHFPLGVEGLPHPELIDRLILHFLNERSLNGFDMAQLKQMTI